MNTERSIARSTLLKKAALGKSAGVTGDSLAAITTGGGTIGKLMGLIESPDSKNNPDTRVSSFLPHVGAYRLSQRKRRVSDASNSAGMHGTANLTAELLGDITTSVGTGVSGAMLGWKLSQGKPKVERGMYARLGGIAGIAIPTLIALSIAAIRRKRSKQEQISADTAGRAALKYVVPGLAAYDSAKRLGTSSHYDEKQKKAAEDRSCARRSVLKGAIVR